MNRITILEQDSNPRFDVVIDGRRLSDYFVGQRGAHPSQVFALGWVAAARNVEQKIVDLFLMRSRLPLSSGRIPGDRRSHSSIWHTALDIQESSWEYRWCEELIESEEPLESKHGQTPRGFLHGKTRD